LGKRQVRREGRTIELNRACLEILIMLMKASPNVVSRKEIEYALWRDMPPGSDVLRTHIYALRQAADKPFTYPMIQTVHGIGYQLVDPDDI
jgi:DNA-binding response OmpR family regulator